MAAAPKGCGTRAAARRDKANCAKGFVGKEGVQEEVQAGSWWPRVGVGPGARVGGKNCVVSGRVDSRP